MKSTARLSICKTYRFNLKRIWSEKPAAKLVTFIGLNPSTADATLDDPTLRRCIDFSQRWGYDGLLLVNLFAYRATDPEMLKRCADPVGPNNDGYIARAIKRSELVIACWGENGSLHDRSTKLRQRYKHDLHCLNTNSSGEPSHPLYQRKSCTPTLLR